jgi:hypothetical protein
MDVSDPKFQNSVSRLKGAKIVLHLSTCKALRARKTTAKDSCMPNEMVVDKLVWVTLLVLIRKQNLSSPTSAW